MKAYLVSLGCPKNLTDTEVLMGKLAASGYEITSDPSQAEIIIVNTCAFLKTARDESIQTIREMKKYGKKVYMAGCLPKTRDSRLVIHDIDGIINSIGLFNHCTPRIKATPPWYAYVKIAEGCNNRCSYCLVPLIRGRLRTRKMEDVLEEIKILAKRGVKEVIYVAQDTTAYPGFADLLEKTARIQGIRWIRIMYAHPAHVSDKLIEVMAIEKKIVKYLDLPIQHCCDKLLKLMHRRYTRLDLENLIFKIRRRIPNLALRTSVIVGFPGEGETKFEELINFIRKVKFERLGVFTYQREEGTPASKMGEQVSQKVKDQRFHRVMQVQARISRELNTRLIGRTLNTIIEKTVRGGFSGRSYLDAPDIDGSVFIQSKKPLKPGEFVKARVTGAKTYDLTCLPAGRSVCVT